MYLHIAGALEFLVDYIVHAAAGLDEGGGDYGEAAAVFDVSCGAEETLGLVESSGVHTAGKGFAGGGNGYVVGAGKAGDGVYQHHNVFALLHKAHGALVGHFRNPGVMLGQLVKGGIKHLALYAALHVGNFLGTFVYQQHDEGNIGVIFGYSVCDVLEQRSLAALGLAYDKAALAFADGGD